MIKYSSILRLIFFLFSLIISANHIRCQTLDGKKVYLDTVFYLTDCRIDSIIFNKTLNQNDTFTYCMYSEKFIYREIENDSLYDIQTVLLKNGNFINGIKYGVLNFYDNNGNKRVYCWERLTGSHPFYYFNDYRIGWNMISQTFHITKHEIHFGRTSMLLK